MAYSNADLTYLDQFLGGGAQCTGRHEWPPWDSGEARRPLHHDPRISMDLMARAWRREISGRVDLPQKARPSSPLFTRQPGSLIQRDKDYFRRTIFLVSVRSPAVRR
jgi:hypothetical protein